MGCLPIIARIDYVLCNLLIPIFVLYFSYLVFR